MPVLEREEYIEQAYFFHSFRERLIDGLASQEILARIGEELLSTTKLPLAVSFLHVEMKGTGQMGPAMERINHYFTPFQAHVVSQAESDVSRFAMDQALLILEREAKFKADSPSLPALFVFQFEAISRNRLGYTKGLAAMAGDPLYTEDWIDYILTLRSRLGDVDFADLIFVRSEQFARERRADQPRLRPQVPDPLRRERRQDRAGQPGTRSDVPLHGTSAPARLSRSPPPPPARRARSPRLAPRTKDRHARKPTQVGRERYPARRRSRPGPRQARGHGGSAQGMGPERIGIVRGQSSVVSRNSNPSAWRCSDEISESGVPGLRLLLVFTAYCLLPTAYSQELDRIVIDANFPAPIKSKSPTSMATRSPTSSPWAEVPAPGMRTRPGRSGS